MSQFVRITVLDIFFFAVEVVLVLTWKSLLVTAVWLLSVSSALKM